MKSAFAFAGIMAVFGFFFWSALAIPALLVIGWPWFSLLYLVKGGIWIGGMGGFVVGLQTLLEESAADIKTYVSHFRACNDKVSELEKSLEEITP